MLPWPIGGNYHGQPARRPWQVRRKVTTLAEILGRGPGNPI